MREGKQYAKRYQAKINRQIIPDMKIWRIISFFLLLVAVQTASGRKIKMVDRKATKETRAL